MGVPRTAVYVRVSSKAQTAVLKESDLARWVESQNTAVEWYKDVGTGRTMSRPGFNLLLERAVAGLISTVVVWKIDRLGRTAHGLLGVFDEFSRHGIVVISLKDGIINLANPAERLMAGILACHAQYELEVSTQRIRAGQGIAIANGKRWGGSLPGVRKKVTLNQELLIGQLHFEGMSIVDIAKWTGLSRPTIYDVLGQK